MSSARSWRARGRAIEERRRAEAERVAEVERAAERRAAFIAICDRVAALRGDDAPDEIEKARAEWEGMPGASAQERDDAELRARFDESCRRAVERHQNRQAIERVHTRLGELSLEADRLSTPDDHTPEGPEREAAWRAVADEWQSLAGQVDGLDEAVGARFAEATARVRQREDEKRAAAERTLKQQVQRVEQLVERVTARAAAEDLTLREADRAVRDLKSAMDAPPPVSAREQHALAERVKAAMAVIAPRLHDLREMDEWKRFANAAVQEELIAKAEALRAKYSLDGSTEVLPDGSSATKEAKPDDIEKAARELHEIQERWKQVAEAPRAQAQALWHRYRQAADPIQTKARVFFAQRAEERTANLRLKMALVERAEALAESTDWIKTADELKKLQADWQLVGPVPRQDTKITWKRFRDACDRFFTRRNADLTERKETWTANLAKKDALCARAEQIASSREWERGASEIRRLQAEWKTIGPVRRTKSEAIWQRFRTACDTFFERYKRRDEIRARSQAGRPRRPRHRARNARGSCRGRRGSGTRRAVGFARARPLAAHAVEPDVIPRAAGSRSAERALHRCARAPHDGPPRCIQGHRARRRGEPPEDGEALRPRRGIPDRRRARPGGLAGARRNVAGSARLQHDRRTRRRRSEVARDGRRSTPGPGVVEPPRPGSGRSRQPADRTVPQGVQPLLRSAPPQGAANAAAAARQAGGGEIGSRLQALGSSKRGSITILKILPRA